MKTKPYNPFLVLCSNLAFRQFSNACNFQKHTWLYELLEKSMNSVMNQIS